MVAAVEGVISWCCIVHLCQKKKKVNLLVLTAMRMSDYGRVLDW
jgi:hypothetical protein